VAIVALESRCLAQGVELEGSPRAPGYSLRLAEQFPRLVDHGSDFLRADHCIHAVVALEADIEGIEQQR
jgi:hypothetical protein